jgi:hypothetical protein
VLANEVAIDEVTLTVVVVATPESFVYDIEIVGAAGTGVTVKMLGVAETKVIKTVTAGAGRFESGSEYVCVTPANRPHPFAVVVPVFAWTVKLTAFEVAVPLTLIGDTTSQDGSAAGVITPDRTVPGTTVNGVPRLAVEVTETTLGVPGT